MVPHAIGNALKTLVAISTGLEGFTFDKADAFCSGGGGGGDGNRSQAARHACAIQLGFIQHSPEFAHWVHCSSEASGGGGGGGGGNRSQASRQCVSI